MKGKITYTIKVEAATIRNPFALHASRRKATRFKDRRAPRGGDRNKQREYQSEG